MPDFDYTKPFRQKNGRAARNARRSCLINHPIEAEILTLDGVWTTADFTLDGHYWTEGESDMDLINIPEPQEEAMKLDFNRPFMDSQKRPARLVCNDRQNHVGLTHLWLVMAGTNEEVFATDEHGMNSGTPYIVNVPEVHEVWANVNKDNGSAKLYADVGYESKEQADKHARCNRVGRHPVTIRAEFVE